uniref:Sorting nexin 14 n=1 Tax=Myripristis murdjan TaxID=586833 RepID=A0A667Z834_9TELE
RMAGIQAYLENLKQGLKIDVLRETSRQYPVFCFLLLSMLSFTVLLNRYIHILMVFWSFLAGIITFYCSLGPESLLPNILFTLKPRNKVSQHRCIDEAYTGVLSPIYRPTLLLENYQPWLDLKIFSKVDASIAEVFELVLENFVYPWYSDVNSIDVDISVFLSPVNSEEGLQQAALDEYGPDLHIALHSRKDELLYLRKLTEMLFDFVMPPKATESTEPPSPLIPFLQKYAECSNKKPSVLKLELKEIREQQDLLFRFMNFLKQEGAVHVLQFCLTEFNDKILSPELSDSELQRLHSEVVHIYETYCLEESIDKISFDPFIVEEIRNIAKGPYTGVVKLQTMRCLFEAYEHVLSLLEAVFTPMFCHSDEYFRHLLRGAESPARNSRINRNTSKRGESFGISRIGSKIKGVFKSTTLEGSLLPPSAMNDAEEDFVEEATVVLEDNSPAEPASTPGALRNLSAWSITIPYIDFYEDEVKREKIPVFCIDVERNDRKEVGHETEKWSVYRRYLEFYVLESKLTEFHGTFADAQLPSKRIIGPKNYEFLMTKREEFEEYLKRLLQHPELSNSQLLADFLSPYSMESQFLDKMLPDVNLGKIFKSVPGKLIKEKGQNLEPFIQSFFNSCESPKPKPSRPELTIISPTAENNKKLLSNLFKNNANLSEGPERRHNQNYFMEMMTVDGMYDCMMYVGRVVFHMPDWLHHVMAAGRILFRNTFDTYMDHYMQSRLDQILQEHRMVSLITQLRDAVFCETCEERTPEDKQIRAKQTFEEMMKYLPDFVGKCIGEEAKYEGIRLLFDGFQQPLLNKQVNCIPEMFLFSTVMRV